MPHLASPFLIYNYFSCAQNLGKTAKFTEKNIRKTAKFGKISLEKRQIIINFAYTSEFI